MNSALTMHQIQVENSLRLLFLMILTANFTTGQFLRRIFDSSGHFAVFDDHKLYKKMRIKYLDPLKEKGNVCFIKWSRVFSNCAFLIRNLSRLSISILPHFRFNFFVQNEHNVMSVDQSFIDVDVCIDSREMFQFWKWKKKKNWNFDYFSFKTKSFRWKKRRIRTEINK